jgi:hypothetical protein
VCEAYCCLYVFPLEGEELARAHPGVDGEDIEGVEPVGFSRGAGYGEQRLL